jgi:hypothetical protein
MTIDMADSFQGITREEDCKERNRLRAVDCALA